MSRDGEKKGPGRGRRAVAFSGLDVAVPAQARTQARDDGDLLDFVQALGELDDVAGPDADAGLAASAVDVDDFTAVLDADDASFGHLKRRMGVLAGEEGARRSEEAPLPLRQQARIDRMLAYEKTARDMSKWTGIIQRNRDAEQLRFPLPEQAPVATVTSHALVASFRPETALEREVASLIGGGLAAGSLGAGTGSVGAGAGAGGVGAGAGSAHTRTDTDTHAFDAGFEDLPTVALDAEAVQRELVRARSSRFFEDMRARRQAKIKSKAYRRMLARERMRREAEAIAAGNLGELGRLGLLAVTAEDGDARQERRVRADMQRARERLTLKTRRVNKWAQALMNKRHGDPDGRLRILEQLRDKERLRQEIYGAAEHGSESEGDEDEGEEDEGLDDGDLDEDLDEDQGADLSEVNGIFADVAAGAAVVTGRHRFGGAVAGAGAVPSDAEEEALAAADAAFDADLASGLVRPSAKGLGAGTVKGTGKGIDKGKDHWHAEQEALVKEAFADDAVFADFAAEKAQTVDAEAPRVEDVTLPGWGAWGGAGISAENSRSRRARFVVHRDGLDPRARLDRNLAHVIINERRIKSAAAALTAPRVPFPFASAEEHAQHIAQPIGKEWNTLTCHRKRVRPRVQVTPGAIINPIKFFKQARHV